MSIDINKKYKTRDGREVRIYATDAGGEYPIHGAILLGRVWYPRNWADNGRYHPECEESDMDLIEVKPERVVWVSEYEGGTVKFSSKTDADSFSCPPYGDRTAIHRVVLSEATVWKEGDPE